MCILDHWYQQMSEEYDKQMCKIPREIQKNGTTKMSTLPVERIKPSPQFLNVMIDYFEPFIIRGEVQKWKGGTWGCANLHEL